MQSFVFGTALRRRVLYRSDRKVQPPESALSHKVSMLLSMLGGVLQLCFLQSC